MHNVATITRVITTRNRKLLEGSISPVRLAAPYDADEVAACLVAFRNFLGATEPRDSALAFGVRYALDQELAEFLLVGWPAHSYVQLRYVYSAWLQSEICWVEDVFVAAEHRRLGIGRALMRAAECRARKRGCARMQLDVNEHNTAALALYESEGYSAHNDAWRGGKDLYLRYQLTEGDAAYRASRPPTGRSGGRGPRSP